MPRSALGAITASVLFLLADPALSQSRSRYQNPRGVPHGDSLVGDWHTSLPSRAIVHVFPEGDSTFVATIPGEFRASCFIDGSKVIGLARFSSPVGPGPKDWTRYLLMTASWSDAVTLQVTWVSPLSGVTHSEDTWRYGRPGDPQSRGSGAADSLPRLGDYVYVEELPEAIERVAPDYPTWAQDKGVQGTVFVQALVGRDGRVRDVRVVSSIPMLDDYAIAAVKQWRFRPAMTGGVPVAVWVGVPVKFSLH
jgi:protein TonB